MPSVWYYLLALALAKNPVVRVSSALYSVVWFLGPTSTPKAGPSVVFIFLYVIEVAAKLLQCLCKKKDTQDSAQVILGWSTLGIRW